MFYLLLPNLYVKEEENKATFYFVLVILAICLFTSQILSTHFVNDNFEFEHQANFF